MFYDYFPYVCDEEVEFLEAEVCSAIEEMAKISELHGSEILYDSYEVVEAKMVGLRMDVTLKNGGYAGHVRYLEKMEVGKRRRTSKKPKRLKAPHKR
jgi:hypothetical protein